ncbi:MAG: translation initiation factor IF-3 [Acidimicrobiales bacterium]
MNDRIRAREVRLVDPEGVQLGIRNLPDALELARSFDLDLVEVAPLASPPVCKILDYGKWKYETAQRDKESRKRSSSASIKEMKYRPKIGAGDFETKTRKVGEFIDQGHKVKITIMFRGREVAHPELGKKILDRVAELLSLAKVEAAPKLDGRNMIMVLAPDRRARAAKEAADKEALASGITTPEVAVTQAPAPQAAKESTAVGAGGMEAETPEVKTAIDDGADREAEPAGQDRKDA